MPCCSVTTRRTVSLAARSIVAGREVLGRHAAPDQPALQDLPQRVHLELVVGGERDACSRSRLSSIAAREPLKS